MTVHIDPQTLDHRLTPQAGKMLGAKGGLRFSQDLKPASPVALVRQSRARTQMRYQLQDASGAWANIDLSGLANTAKAGWIGFTGQLEAVRRGYPQFATFKVVPVFPVGKTGFVP